MSKEGGPLGSDSPARTSSMFYKLMVASILQDKNLKIPKIFVKKYGDELSHIATLTVPNGQIWLVELQKINGKIWFQTGWHEFVEYYSIKVGYFLVFRYEGNSNFNVHIFDLTISEINYTCGRFSCSQEPDHGNHIYKKRHDNQCLLTHKKGDVTEILGFGPALPTSDSTRSKTFDEFVHFNWIKSGNDWTGVERSHVKKEVDDLEDNFHSQEIGIHFSGRELTSTADEVGLLISGKEEGRRRRQKRRTETNKHELLGVQEVDVKSTRVKIASGSCTRRWRAVTTEEREKTIYAARMFKTDNPFCRVILRPSYVYRGFLLHLPSSFGQKYLKGVTGFIKLQVSNGKQWPVRLVFRNDGAKLSQGWTEFVWENNLEEGDVCVFELINAKDIVLQVTVFRVLEEAAPLHLLTNAESS